MSTTDGGTTWQMDVLDDYPDETELRALDFIDSGYGWATGVSGLTLKTHFPVNIEENNTVSGLSIFPNPFTTSTTFEYDLAKPGDVQFTIYNVQSQIVFRMQEKQDKGVQRVIWSAEGLPAGMYYCRIMAEGKVGSGKLVVSD